MAAGDAMLSPPVTRRLLGTFARLGGPRGPTRDQVDRLTERETEALTLIARGRSNAEIAEDLVVAEQTVKTHVRRILASWASGTGPRRPSSPTRPAWCGRTATRAEQLLGRCLTVGDGDDPARTTPQRGLGQRSPGSPCSTGVVFGPGRQRGMADRHATELDVPGDEVSLGDLDRHVSNIERHHMAVILAGQSLTR